MSALQQTLAPFLQAEYSCSAAHMEAMWGTRPFIDWIVHKSHCMLYTVKSLPAG